MYYGVKQGQITPNIENKCVSKLIHLVAQYSKITNTLLFLKRVLHRFSAFCCFLLVMSECPKVHFVALRFIYTSQKFLTTTRDFSPIFLEAKTTKNVLFASMNTLTCL